MSASEDSNTVLVKNQPEPTAGPISLSFRSVLPTLAFVALVYMATIALSPLDGFWTTDDANKYLQMQGIISSHWQGAQLPWPGREIDPECRYIPVPDPFSRLYQGRLYSIFPPFFAALTSFFYLQFGFAGLYVLPFISSLFLLVGLGRIALALTGRSGVQHLSILLAGLCTPLWFYSVVFWEHVIAVSFGVWSILFFLRYLKREALTDLVLGNLFLAMAIYLRDEMYLFAAVVIVAVTAASKTRRIPRAIFSCALVTVAIAPLWAYQAWTIDSPMGHHLGDYFLSVAGIKKMILDRPHVIYSLFLAANPTVWVSILMSLPLVAALFLRPKPASAAFMPSLPVLSLLAVACSLAYLVGLYSANSFIAYIIRTCNGFFVAAPIIVLGCVRLRTDPEEDTDTRRIRWLWITFLAYALAYGLAAQSGGLRGIHWGNRYILILYPILALLAAINIAGWVRRICPEKKAWIVPVALLIVVSFGMQVFSIGLLHRKKEFSSRLNRTLDSMPERVIITDQWWAGHEMCSQFYRKLVFYVRSPQDTEELAGRLAKKGETRFVYATSAAKGGTLQNGTPVTDNGLNFYSLVLCPGRIAPPAPDTGPP